MSKCYCDPFKIHKTRNDAITFFITKVFLLHQSNVSLENGNKQCRKKILQMPVEVTVEQSISSTSEEEGQQKSRDTTESETENHELHQLNISLGSIDETLVRKRLFQSLQYPQNKLQKVNSAIRKRLEFIWYAASRRYDL